MRLHNVDELNVRTSDSAYVLLLALRALYDTGLGVVEHLFCISSLLFECSPPQPYTLTLLSPTILAFYSFTHDIGFSSSLLMRFTHSALQRHVDL